MLHVSYRMLLAASLTLIGLPALAGERSPNVPAEPAATASLPASLQALDAAPAQVLSRGQAGEIRGQWWIQFSNSSGSLFFQGIGSPFQLFLVTDSASDPNRYVGLRVTIGR